MKSYQKEWLLGIFAVILAVIIRQTNFKGHYWLLVIFIPIVLFLLLRGIVGIYNSIVKYKKDKNIWEGTGARIQMYNDITNISSKGMLSNNNLKTMRIWLDWVIQHPSEIKTAQAFKEILTKLINSPEDSGLLKSTRDEAQSMLIKLVAASLTEAEKK
jgi:hypothetical protein